MSTTKAPYPICQHADQPFYMTGLNVLNYTCATCGPYSISGPVHDSWQRISVSLSKEQITYASAWVRQNGPLLITDAELPTLRDLI